MLQGDFASAFHSAWKRIKISVSSWKEAKIVYVFYMCSYTASICLCE